MAYRDWSDEQKQEFYDSAFANIYNEIPSVPYLSEDDDEIARELFEKGWVTFGEYSPEELYGIRQDFFDMTYMPENLFRALGFWANYRALYDDVDSE